jgi:gliding motility-associated-like protein
VAVLDSCDNRSPISFQHQTMYLQSTLDVCLQEVSLQWNAYTGWPVTSYNVYMGENGAAPTLLTNSGTALDAIHQGLTPFSSYCYFVEAIGPNGETARSNQLCVFADIPVWPNFLYTRYVTVDYLAGFVEIMAYVDTAADINEYIIERSNTIFGPYTQIASLPQPIGGDMITHYDMTAAYNNRPYYYRIMAVDSCGTIAFESDTSNSIHLSVIPYEDLRNELDWTDYGRWDGGVESYNIYRIIDAGAPTLLDNVPGTTNSYVDDLNQSFTGLSGQGSFCYMIEALEGTGNTYGFQEVSMSNLSCVSQNPRIFIPNAFNPNSPFPDNQTFKPSALFLESSPYEMFIYNRWGQLMFYTTVPSEGWNGTYNDEDQPGAVYMYRIRYTDLNGEVHDYQGHLTLIR